MAPSQRESHLRDGVPGLSVDTNAIVNEPLRTGP